MAAQPPLLRRRRRRPEGLRIGGHLGAAPFALIALAVFALLLLVWWLVTVAGPRLGRSSCRRRSAVWDRLRELEQSGELLGRPRRISIYRIAVGFPLATVDGRAARRADGLLRACGRRRSSRSSTSSATCRSSAFVPLTILWVGTGDTQKFLIIWIGTFFQQVLLVMDNVKRVPPSFVDLGRTLGLPERAILMRIVVPSAMPGIWDSLRISLGWAWTWLVRGRARAPRPRASATASPTAQRFFQTDTIFGYLLVLGMLGLVTDQAHEGSLGRRFFRYLEGRADERRQAAHRRPRQGLPHATAAPSSRSTASTSRSARTSSSRWSAPRAAASARCSRSSPG